MIIIHIIHALFMRVQTEIRDGITKRPDFDGMVQAGRGERLGVFGVKGERHNVVCVAFEYLLISVMVDSHSKVGVGWPCGAEYRMV